MENLTTPPPVPYPFANNGDKNNIPIQPTGSNKASYTEGFPPITSEQPPNGIPPERADMNGVLNAATFAPWFLMSGGSFTFNPAHSTLIGGYALGAYLWGQTAAGKSFIVRSIRANNTDNFVAQPAYIGTAAGQINTVDGVDYQVSWVYAMVTQEYVDSTFANTDLSNINTIPIEQPVVAGTLYDAPDVVVQYWVGGNATSAPPSIRYWRRYKSGFIMQAGQQPGPNGRDAYLSITYPTPFAYGGIPVFAIGAGGYGTHTSTAIQQQTRTYFSIRSYDFMSRNPPWMWFATGI